MTAPFHCIVDASVAVKLYLAEPLAAEVVLSLTGTCANSRSLDRGSEADCLATACGEKP